MQVLVNESEPNAAGIATVQLEARGHQVLRCHDPEDEQGFPCVGLATGHCPVEEENVDVALTVRGPSHPLPTALEDGITCALRHRIPVVVSGDITPNPFAAFGAVAAEKDVVGACERAAAARRSDHEAVASKALSWTLRYRDLPLDTAHAAVRRCGDGLHVTLYVPAETPKIVRAMAAVRVVGALRAFDTAASAINIVCEVNGVIPKTIVIPLDSSDLAERSRRRGHREPGCADHHSALAHAVLGSTTMSVLNVTSCPVLVVPPHES